MVRRPGVFAHLENHDAVGPVHAGGTDEVVHHVIEPGDGAGVECGGGSARRGDDGECSVAHHHLEVDAVLGRRQDEHERLVHGQREVADRRASETGLASERDCGRPGQRSSRAPRWQGEPDAFPPLVVVVEGGGSAVRHGAMVAQLRERLRWRGGILCCMDTTNETNTAPMAAAPSHTGELPLAGQGALVTGGGSGIGLACARELVRMGAAVTLAGRTPERVEAAAAELASLAPDGVPVGWAACDTAVEDDVVAAVAAASAATGSVQLAVAAAGTGSMSPVIATDRDQWDQVLATNLTGTMLLFKHVGASAVRAGGGSMVAISSIAGHASHRWMAAYCVSKAGVDMLVRTAADELGRHGVRVNSVRPGLVDTELAAMLVNDEGIVADYQAQMPVSRVGVTADVGALVGFLCSPAASWITGENIHVDGGHHLRRGPDLDPAARLLFGDDLVG